MAPSDRARDTGKDSDDTANPFVSFRRFADEQMSNLLNGVFRLSSTCSSSSSSPDRALQDYQSWLQDARQSQHDLRREAEESERIMDVYTSAHRDSADEEILQALREAEGSLRCPYRPADQEIPQHHDDPSQPSLAAFGMHLPYTILTTPVLGKRVSSVPIAYLLYSPYSPIRLEQERALRDRGVHWREAFEDLLAVQDGQDISSDCENDSSISSVTWVRRMIGLAMCKRDLEKDEGDGDGNLQTLDRIPGKEVPSPTLSQPENDATEDSRRQVYGGFDHNESDNGQVSELDVYKHLLGMQEDTSSGEPYPSESQSRSQSRPLERLQHESNRTETDKMKPSILSTLTTTERTTLPDGTTHTKVVLKKRFSDGREESTETMSTQNPLPKPQYQPPAQTIDNQRTSEDPLRVNDKDKKRNSGWFWS